MCTSGRPIIRAADYYGRYSQIFQIISTGMKLTDIGQTSPTVHAAISANLLLRILFRAGVPNPRDVAPLQPGRKGCFVSRAVGKSEMTSSLTAQLPSLPFSDPTAGTRRLLLTELQQWVSRESCLSPPALHVEVYPLGCRWGEAASSVSSDKLHSVGR